MKRFFTLLCVSLWASFMAAQRLCVHTGAVTWVQVASEAPLTLTPQRALLWQGQAIPLAEIDSITFDGQPYDPHRVQVQYNGHQAHVTLPLEVFDKMHPQVKGAHVTIDAGSLVNHEYVYQLSGKGTAANFTLMGNYKAKIILQGLSLHSDEGPALNIQNGKRIALIAADQTDNYFEDPIFGEHKACVFVKGHAEWSGSGTVRILGNARHAYASNEYTAFKSNFGTLQILGAAKDGLHIQQYLQLKGGTINIEQVRSDGIDVEATTHPADEKNGEIEITDGQISIRLMADNAKAIKCQQHCVLTGGSFQLSAQGDGVKGLSVGGDLTIAGADLNISVAGNVYHKGMEDESKTRGILTRGNFTLSGGSVEVEASGKKAKPVKVDGQFFHHGGSINCPVEAGGAVATNKNS